MNSCTSNEVFREKIALKSSICGRKQILLIVKIIFHSVSETGSPTSSEFNAGIQLTDSRIVLGGRVTYPQFPNPAKIVGSPYYNQACVLFMTNKGVSLIC